MNRTLVPIAILLTLAWCLLPGCGGGGSEGVGGTRGSVAFTVHWPTSSTSQVSTAMLPEAVRSLTVALTQDGQEVAPRQTLTRAAGGAATAEARFDNLPPVLLTATATAYPKADGTGVALATGSVPVQIPAGGVARATLVLGSTIATVELSPALTNMALGTTQQLTATARDAGGNVVLLTPSALSWASASESVATVDADGLVSGVAVGHTQLTVTDTESGQSGSAEVNVASLGPGSISGTVSTVGSASFASGVRALVPGATVTTSDGRNLYTTTTAADGSFVLSNVPGGMRVVSVAASGFGTSNVQTVMRGSALTVNVQLAPTVATSPTSAPTIAPGAPVVDAARGLATLSGTIGRLDCTTAVLVQNAEESLLSATGGVLAHTVVLQPGSNELVLRASNAAGSTLSEVGSVDCDGDFYFRVTVTWDGAKDVDAHVWAPGGEHCFFADKDISCGALDADNTAGYGPEDFTCSSLAAGLFRVATDYYGGASPVGCVLRVTSGTKAGNQVSELFGPHTLTAGDNGEGYPVTGDTASWWRPCDLRLAADGTLTVEAPDTGVALTEVRSGAKLRAAKSASR